MLRIENLKGDIFGPVDLKITAGECVAIRGPSGAGKSLLLRAVVDLDVNEGDVWWNGRSRNSMPANEWRSLVGLVPADSGWWADRVAAHFEPGSNCAELVEAIGLPPEAMDWDVTRLSTGERHRLAIVRTLCNEPEVLLLDEPTASLDGDATSKVERLLRRQLSRGAAILLVTHDGDQANRFASRTAQMSSGRLTMATVNSP